jgi:inositol transport system ATP-binding protein
MENRSDIVLEMKGISKQFPGVLALDNVNFRLTSGKVHALMGENGAGKSTLMKALAGIQPADTGEIIYKGTPVCFQTPKQALNNGIAMIHQELSPIMDMSIAENLFLGKEIRRGKSRTVDFKRMKEQTSKLMKRVGMELDPNTLMKNLTVSQMQMVEIAKALSYDSEIIIMDEPSSSITTREVKNLFGIINQLKEEGRCIVYITHKLDEVFEIADEVTVFRDGHYIGTYDAKEMDKKKLIKLMVDRELDEIYPQRHSKIGKVKLKVDKLSRKGSFQDVSFQLHAGEILGLAGLIGAGRTEIADTIFGVEKATSGSIYINDEKVNNFKPSRIISKGVGYVTEDRKRTGLIMEMSIQDNCIIASLKHFTTRFGWIKNKLAIAESEKFIKKLQIKTTSAQKLVKDLSGGNQQKVVLAKWLMMDPDIIIFDEPTRGIDVGAKSEIYRLIASLAEQGAAVIFISSEMSEILGMCDRIIVLHEGTVSGNLDIGDTTQEKLMSLATGLVN